MIRHQLDTMLRERVYGVAGGYEDLNDHESLRFDQTLQTATGEASVLAGKSTLCRMEQTMDRQTIVKTHEPQAPLRDQFPLRRRVQTLLRAVLRPR